MQDVKFDLDLKCGTPNDVIEFLQNANCEIKAEMAFNKMHVNINGYSLSVLAALDCMYQEVISNIKKNTDSIMALSFINEHIDFISMLKEQIAEDINNEES